MQTKVKYNHDNIYHCLVKIHPKVGPTRAWLQPQTLLLRIANAQFVAVHSHTQKAAVRKCGKTIPLKSLKTTLPHGDC